MAASKAAKTAGTNASMSKRGRNPEKRRATTAMENPPTKAEDIIAEGDEKKVSVL
ncbi:MAG: hypothetical protein INF79_17505 [Roseomonas sp.]|nr:hypothetical protein [Roseomonas sp.]